MPGTPRKRRRPSKILYSRELPGGGYVTIQSEPCDNESYRGWISVERRAERNRRDNDAVPVIAETQGNSPDAVLGALQAIAADNVAVAKGIRAWEAENPSSAGG